MRLAILGGGSWGTALAMVLAPRFDGVHLWVYEPDLARRMQAARENDVYLPGLPVPSAIEITTDLAAALAGADIVLGVVPSHFARGLWRRALPHLDSAATFVSATKGLESGTLLRMSEVLAEVVHLRFEPRIAVLSGPTFAREVAQGEPAAVVVASSDAETAGRVQKSFSGPTFRLYASSDPLGVEIGGALKNVIAIAAGAVEGLGLGNNTMAALITRGLAEITRLAVAMGAHPKTLAGLAGLGDLVLTCTGDLSRNRRVGIELARGRTLAGITASTPMIAEGVETCGSAVALGAKFGVDLPIIQQMHEVLHLSKPPREALRDLMERSLKSE
ncbi:MAG TPA: NAD(P)H-dependent glycerol-3-phosphate dehydrogenase [Bryobacteraceae bacterium]|nr:NAD(P)H-dependent glycerol-3-phosphate dehydrogenase [Bryobacteraceae bacterium]